MKRAYRGPIRSISSTRSVACMGAIGVVMLLVSLVSGAEPAVQPTRLPTGKAFVKPQPGTPIFTRDTSFGRAIQALRQSTRRPLNIVVYWKEIADNAGISQDTPIGADGIVGLTVRQHLEILVGSLSATSGAKLGYVVNRGVIVIATVDRLPKPPKVTRVYDVSDLMAPPSTGFRPRMWGGFGLGMGMRNGPMGMGGLGQYGGLRGQPSGIGSVRGRARRR